MSPGVEDRVVSIRFDNTAFEVGSPQLLRPSINLTIN